jgi:site-specific DNA-methyltransferase (adenine-specific)
VTPYYDHGGITIYHGDCRDVLPVLDATAIIVTDPPYGIADDPITVGDADGWRRGKRRGQSNTYHPASTWDRELDPSWLPLAMRFRIVALFGHWRKRRAFEDTVGIEPRVEFIWAKDTHVGPPCPAAMQDERVWVFAREPFTPQRFETTVWNVPIIPTWKYKHHKNQKPESLMLRLLTWLPVGPVIDPFMGSGTTLLAAKRLGRAAIGIEIDHRYCEIAAERVQQEALPFASP